MQQPFFHLKILTPKGLALETDAVHVRVPDERGSIGVLANHAALVTSSPGGMLTVHGTDNVEKSFRVGSGFFEVAHNQALLLTDACEALA